MIYKYANVEFEGTDEEIRQQLINFCSLDKIKIGYSCVRLLDKHLDTRVNREEPLQVWVDTLRNKVLAVYENWLDTNTVQYLGKRYLKTELRELLEKQPVWYLGDGTFRLGENTHVPGGSLTNDQIKQILIEQILNAN